MRTLNDTLKNLAEVDEPISVAGLYALSGTDKAQLEQVKTVWNTLPDDRRAAIMRHLVEIGEENFETDFNAVFRLGLIDSDPAVRVAAINGLWEEAEDPGLITPLLNLLQTDQNDLVRAAAASALAQFVYAGELDELPADKVKPILTALKATFRNALEPIEVRRRALEALGYLGDDEVHQMIAQAYQHNTDLMRQSALFAMGRSLDAERWGATVIAELTAPEPEMRYEAARAAGEMEYTPAVKALGDLLEDVDEDVQLMTVWALGQVGGDKAKKLLLAVMDSEADHLYEVAEDALAELEFKTDNLDFSLFDFDDDEEDWVLDAEPDEDEDDA
jgi:HEAT repeat protein